MNNEILDENLEGGTLRLPYSLSYVQGAFKAWKITFFLSIILGILGGAVLIYMEYVVFGNEVFYTGNYSETEFNALMNQARTLESTSVIMFVLAGLSFLVNVILQLVLLFKHWTIIQKVNLPSATPGAAVGLIFVPFFNLYWIFIAFYKLSVDQERFIRQYNVQVTKKPLPGLALTAVIMRLIPYLGMLSYFILGPMRIFNQQRVSEDIIKQLGN